MNPYSLFDMFLTLFFLMLALIILVAVAGIVDSYLDPDPEAVSYDLEAQKNDLRGVIK